MFFETIMKDERWEYIAAIRSNSYTNVFGTPKIYKDIELCLLPLSGPDNEGLKGWCIYKVSSARTKARILTTQSTLGNIAHVSSYHDWLVDCYVPVM